MKNKTIDVRAALYLAATMAAAGAILAVTLDFQKKETPMVSNLETPQPVV